MTKEEIAILYPSVAKFNIAASVIENPPDTVFLGIVKKEEDENGYTKVTKVASAMINRKSAILNTDAEYTYHYRRSRSYPEFLDFMADKLAQCYEEGLSYSYTLLRGNAYTKE